MTKYLHALNEKNNQYDIHPFNKNIKCGILENRIKNENINFQDSQEEIYGIEKELTIHLKDKPYNGFLLNKNIGGGGRRVEGDSKSIKIYCIYDKRINNEYQLLCLYQDNTTLKKWLINEIDNGNGNFGLIRYIGVETYFHHQADPCNGERYIQHFDKLRTCMTKIIKNNSPSNWDFYNWYIINNYIQNKLTNGE